MDGYNDIATELGIRDITYCKGHPARAMTVFDDKGQGGQGLLMKSLVQQELIRRGILWSGFHNMCYSHTEADLDYTLEAFGEVLAKLKGALEAGDLASRLRGKPVQPVFRRTDEALISSQGSSGQWSVRGHRPLTTDHCHDKTLLPRQQNRHRHRRAGTHRP
jgi:glutamate-1-semialdehyde 2,1-aminomutase